MFFFFGIEDERCSYKLGENKEYSFSCWIKEGRRICIRVNGDV